MPIYAHNFHNYDSKIVMQALKIGEEDALNILAFNKSRIRTIRLSHLLFLDSLAFIPASLATCVDAIRESGWQFPLLKSSGLTRDEESHAMALSKAHYPYER